MRLWHYKLIPFLPNSQLIAQWRELNSIFKKQDKHILINYVYEYNECHLWNYSRLVIEEMKNRGFKIKSLENFNNYFGSYPKKYLIIHYIFFEHHNNRYLLQCFYNLQEKYDRGQKDFNKEQYERLEAFVKNENYKDYR